MLIPANMNARLMMRSAGAPISSMASDASNIDRSSFGMSWNTRKPSAMIMTA